MSDVNKVIESADREGIHDENGQLIKPVYDLVVESVPIICVDVIPVKVISDAFRLGIITRATGPERGKPAIVGGRIQKNETISAAISRHLLGGLGTAEFTYHNGNSEGHPYYVAQYAHSDHLIDSGYDPTKHAISLNYLIDIDEPRFARDEASDFRWISLDEIPAESAYNHHIAMHRAAAHLQQTDL